MRQLPLFPLPVVLLPVSQLPLHIFEPRYRRLMAHCLESDRRFGIVYHDPDRHGPFLFEEGRVGTVAEIEVFHPLPDGRSLILVRGLTRFRIRGEVESEAPYYEAVVEEYPDPPALLGPLQERRKQSIRRFARALEVLVGEVEGQDDPPLDPGQETSYPLASRLRIDPSWLQSLLELPDEVARLDRLDAVFQAALDRGKES